MKLTIIGAGPGGYTAAFAAAEKGIDMKSAELRELDELWDIAKASKKD